MADSSTPTTTPQLLASTTNKPISWPVLQGGPPSVVTVALATSNIPGDTGDPLFTLPWDTRLTPLLHAAEHVWELIANVQFNNVPDAPGDAYADIRVGISDISAGLNPPKFIVFEHWNWHDPGGPTPDTFNPGNRLAVLDPHLFPVNTLSNGDLQYQGLDTTVFQIFIDGLGRLLGLGSNPTDPKSVEFGTLTTSNRLPDANDIAGLQSIYGPSQLSVPISDAERHVLNALIAPTV